MASQKHKHRGGLIPDKYLSDEQFSKLMKYVRGQADLARMRGRTRGVFDEIIIDILANSGLRASELCNTLIRDLPMSHGKACLWVRDGKGRVSRAIDISERLVNLIARYVRIYRKKAEPEDPLLLSEWGNKLGYRSLHHCVQKLGVRAGIGKLHPHMLRHTYLTRLYNVEKDLRFVQDQAGHADPKTTAIYAQTNNESRKRQVEALDDEFDAKNKADKACS